MKPFIGVLVWAGLLGMGCTPASDGPPLQPAPATLPKAAPAAALPPPAAFAAAAVDDTARPKAIEEATQRLIESGKATPTVTLLQQLSRTRCSLGLLPASRGRMTPAEIYARRRESVLVIAGVYKCDRCPRWHSTTATAFALTPAGAVVTNYHVMNNRSAQAFVAMTYGGAVYPVKEVLAGNETEDVAIVQLDAPGVRFQPVALSPDAPVGSPVAVISHPETRFYCLTAGVVSQYFTHERKGAKGQMMAITADFARGSSGGPVFDECGNVVGFVGSTRSVYYSEKDGKKENLQMVFKQCVPAASVLKLLGPP